MRANKWFLWWCIPAMWVFAIAMRVLLKIWMNKPLETVSETLIYGSICSVGPIIGSLLWYKINKKLRNQK